MVFPYLKKYKFLIKFLDMKERFELLLNKEKAKLELEQGCIVPISVVKVPKFQMEREGEFKKDSRISSMSSLRRASLTSILNETEMLDKDFTDVKEQCAMPSLSLEEQISLHSQSRDKVLQRIQEAKEDQRREISLQSEAEKNRDEAMALHNRLTEIEDRLNGAVIDMVSVELPIEY